MLATFPAAPHSCRVWRLQVSTPQVLRQPVPRAFFPLLPLHCSSLLPEEIAARIGRELRLLACPPPATKLSLQQLASKAASMAGGVAGSGSEQGIAADGLPDWVAQLVEREQGAALGQWQPTEVR